MEIKFIMRFIYYDVLNKLDPVKIGDCMITLD